MCSPAADMQCDFGSYLFTRGGERRRERAEGDGESRRWRKKKKKRQRVRAERERERGEHRGDETDAKRQK